MEKYIGRCEYCGKDHDLRFVCPEYKAFKDIRKIPTISKFKLFLVKIFGKKQVGIDGNHICVSYHWRGKIYVTDEFTTPEGY